MGGVVASNVNVTNVKVGQEFSIVLPTNPSTGYTWNASYNNQYLELVNQSYQPSYPIEEGSGGNETFIFKALKPSDTIITLNYKAPWMSNPAQTVTYDIKIASNTTTNTTNTSTPVTNNSTIGNTSKNNATTVPMQNTGLPLTGLITGALAVVGGIIGSMKK